ncbi:L-seryl-tRNA(Sec) selenium transferase [Azotosporobacter soli]|uniref:L-seryl-tRNA(Sec) selenium transferase n=1 Tax=Azotosporobacter soli TaxID=3055040 RepID=UPI0031FEAB70
MAERSKRDELQASLRRLPGVDKVLEMMLQDETAKRLPASLLTDCARKAVSQVRERVLAGEREIPSALETIVQGGVKEALRAVKPRLRRVINATGVVLHTNLGRAPLSETALQLIQESASGYSNLEFDLQAGVRGSRYSLVVEKICRLTGAEDAVVVNNNAAAVMLLLAAMAKGKEVVVSRGELVEIGGSFRIPAVMEESGAKLLEVGTTNKTHLRDYEAAISEETALLMKVHTSNYRIIGFTSQPEDADIVELGRRKAIPVVEDLGGGLLLPLALPGWQEPTVAEKIAAGFDLVTCSADKLMGAGQAGIIAGKRQYIEKIKKHQLLRALRIDKLSLAALEGTLCDYLVGKEEKIPVLRMLTATQETLANMQQQLAEELAPLEKKGWSIKKCEMSSMAGGGTLPEIEFASCGVAIIPPEAEAASVERHLRAWQIPIIVRVQEGRLLVDVRSLFPADAAEIAAACAAWEAERKR